MNLALGPTFFKTILLGIGAPVPSKARTGWNWFSSLFYGKRLPLGQWGVTQEMDCTADLLLVFVWDKTASGTARSNIGNAMECIFSVLLLPVLEAVLSYTKTRSRSAVQSILNLAPCCPRGSLVPYKSAGLLSKRTVCGMNLKGYAFALVISKFKF